MGESILKLAKRDETLLSCAWVQTNSDASLCGNTARVNLRAAPGAGDSLDGC